MAKMTLQELVDGIKEDSQAGEIGNNADRTATAILRHLNLVGKAFWEMNDWDFGKTDIAMTIAAGTTAAQSLAATIGEIISLGIAGADGELESFTEREWRRWRKQRDTVLPSGTTITTGRIYGFVNRGRDANGNLKVLFVDPPTEATMIEGEGKTRLNPSSYVLADIGATVPNFGYFPEEVEAILYDWVHGRFLRSIKDVRGDALLDSVGVRLTKLKGTTRSQPAARATTRPPDYMRFVARQRGGRKTA